MTLTFQQITQIPDDQYSCTQCDLVPEIIDIDYDSGAIIINCPEHGERNIYISNYFSEELKNVYYSAKCDFTNVLQKDNIDKIFQFCNDCNKMCCSNCSYSHNQKKHNLIKIDEKNCICKQHFQKFEKFCTICKKNICSHNECKCEHDPNNHKKIPKPDNRDINEIQGQINVLKKKKERQDLLIKLLNNLMETYRKHESNYYFSYNISNVAKKIREINSNTNGIDKVNKANVLSRINYLEKKIIDFFNSKFGTNLKLEDNKIVLKDKGIENEDFELLCSIDFPNLEELNLKGNNISILTPIESLKPKKLLKLDLSYNKINNITTLKDILKKKLFPKIQDIILTGNNILIKDLEEIKRLIKGEYIKECKLTYILNNSETKIRLFGHNFFEKNYKNFKIKEKSNKNISEFYEYNGTKNGKVLDITLIMDENVEDLSGMFSECKDLEYINEIFDLNKKVKDISNMFSGCSKLKTLPESMSEWDTSNITNMSGLFYGCESLIKIPDISNWNTINVKTMMAMFNGCKILQYLPNISKWTVSNVEDISCMFNNCSLLEEMPKGMSKWDTKNVKDMGDMFNGCSSLKNLLELTTWNTKNVTSMKNMFKGCKQLTEPPNVTKWTIDKVKDKSGIFTKCAKGYKI